MRANTHSNQVRRRSRQDPPRAARRGARASLRIELAAIIAATALAGCATPPAQPIAATAPSYTLGDLAFPAPAGEGWLLAESRADRVVFARASGGQRSEAAWVQTLSVPGEAIDGFYPLTRIASRLRSWGDARRYSVARQDIQPLDSLTLTCLRRSTYLQEQQDDAARDMRVVDWFCRHPGGARVLMLVHWSERAPPGASFAALDQRADAFFAAIAPRPATPPSAATTDRSTP